jgi:Alternative oxidase
MKSQLDWHARETMDAPAIAKDYWRLKPDAKLLDVMYAVRSDETTHRCVLPVDFSIHPDQVDTS